jgi:hypothetical protein
MGYNGPIIFLTKGNIAATFHLIIEHSETHSLHNLNVDTFNGHTKDLDNGHIKCQYEWQIPILLYSTSKNVRTG